MKVKEVIEALSTLDPEMLVVGRGYEDGYDDIEVRVESLYDEQGPEKSSWWNGRYNETRFGMVDDWADKFNAVVID